MSLPRLRPKAMADPAPPNRRNMKKNRPANSSVNTIIGM